MSFSLDVKKEIMEAKEVSPARASLLSGMILSSGSLVISGKGITFTLSSENEDFINYFLKTLKEEYPFASVEIKEEKIGFKQKSRQDITIDFESGRQILTDLGILTFSLSGDFEISRIGAPHLTYEEDGKREFIKGMFLGTGSVSIPEHVDVKNFSKNAKSRGYHLEIDVQCEEQARYLSDMLADLNIMVRMVERGDFFVVYLKEADSISNLLGLFKAYKSVLSLENERAGREMRNLVNRQANCISANIDKSISSAIKQLDAIDKISQTIGIEALPESLRDVAYARKNNPDATLSEIIDVLSVKITKGALSQRFKKIIELSKEV